MDLYRYINNTAENIEEDGFIVRAYDELHSSVEIPSLTAIVDRINLVGLKNGLDIHYESPSEAIKTPSINVELHLPSSFTISGNGIQPEPKVEESLKEAEAEDTSIESKTKTEE